MLLGRLRIRGKLTLLVTVPLLCMLGLTLPVVWERTGVAQRAGDIDQTVQLASRVGTLLQHMQRERMLAIGFLLGQVERVAPRTMRLLWRSRRSSRGRSMTGSERCLL